MASGATKSFVLDAQGQAELLKEALRNVQDQAFRMKRSMDASELNGVLKHAAELLRELRTSLLSPKNYYELYMQVLDELRHLGTYVDDLHATGGTSIRSLYERVQSSGNVLPRLYLLVTVGAVYIKTHEAPARDVLTDLVEMTKGVQHPLRGLFLRHYLTVCVKDVLPDTKMHNVNNPNSSNNVHDAIGFLVHNLRETNRLWIRMQSSRNAHSTVRTGSLAKPLDAKAAREAERQDLRVLIGTSLVRMSQLDGVTLDVFGLNVLPSILDVITACNDRIAQEYLFDCVIHVFPDEFHFANLEQLLLATTELTPHVDVAAILRGLIDRLTAFLAAQTPLESQCDATIAEKRLELLVPRVAALIASSSTAAAPPLASMMQVLNSLTQFTLASIRDDVTNRLSYWLDRILQLCFEVVTTVFRNKSNCSETTATIALNVEALAVALVEKLRLATLVRVPILLQVTAQALPWTTARTHVAFAFAHALMTHSSSDATDRCIMTVEHVAFVFELLAPLVRDAVASDALGGEMMTQSPSSDAFYEAQFKLAQLVHLIWNDDCNTHFALLKAARRAFGHGGVDRMRVTLVPLVFAALSLTRRVSHATTTTTSVATAMEGLNMLSAINLKPSTLTTTPRDVLQFVHEIVTALAAQSEQMSVTCVNLFLQCALVADACCCSDQTLEAIAYEFMTQAFIVLEDQISHSRDQWRALELLVTSLRATTHLSRANYEVLATKTTQHAAQLLKKHDQAAMVLHCAHLFWHPCLLDGKRVLECLQRALRIADAIGGTSSTQVPLFIEILEAYMYFFEAKTPEVTQQFVSGLCALVKDHLENMEFGATRSASEMRFRDILRDRDARAHATASSALPLGAS